MAQCGNKHKKLNDQGYGKCSVPMWQYPGVPAGFCDRIAFGQPTKEGKRRYNHHVPYLACYGHGGPRYNQLMQLNPDRPYHLGDPCIYCGTPHDDVESGPCPAHIKERR